MAKLPPEDPLPDRRRFDQSGLRLPESSWGASP